MNSAPKKKKDSDEGDRMTRRNFLGLGAAAAGTALTSGLTYAASEKREPKGTGDALLNKASEQREQIQEGEVRMIAPHALEMTYMGRKQTFFFEDMGQNVYRLFNNSFNLYMEGHLPQGEERTILKPHKKKTN